MIWSNHSCEPNIGIQGQIAFVALRDTGAGEELTHDWATTDDDRYQMSCRCGAAACRGVITGQDWRRPDLQDNDRGDMAWDLLRKIGQGRGEAAANGGAGVDGERDRRAGEPPGARPRPAPPGPTGHGHRAVRPRADPVVLPPRMDRPPVVDRGRRPLDTG